MEKEHLSPNSLPYFMQDKVFVDYLNVFLSLPIFAQRLFYKIKDGNFEFDPPLSRIDMVLADNKLLQWLWDERLTYFQQSSLFIDYQLNCKLRETRIQITESSHNVYRDIDNSERKTWEMKYMDGLLGHVIGMCQFREFLSGTMGDTVLQFWIDAQQLKLTPDDDTERRFNLWRDLQLKYFKVNGLIQLKDNQMWNVLKGGSSVLERLDATIRKSKILEKENVSLDQLQDAVLLVLQKYWLQKFLMHVKYAQTEIRSAGLHDVQLQENLTGINRIITLVQPPPSSQRSNEKWQGLFSKELHLNADIFSKMREVVTLHSDGRSSVEPTDPDIMDKMLKQYQEIDQKDGAGPSTDPGYYMQQISDRVKEKIREKYTNVQCENNHINVQDFVDSNRLYLKGFMDGFSTKLIPKPNQNTAEEETANIKSKTKITLPAIVPNAPSAKDCRQACAPRARTPRISKFASVQGNKKYCEKTSSKESTGFAVGHSMPLVSPYELESTLTISSWNIRAPKRLFFCSLAVDQIAGGPFEMFLDRTGNPCAINSMHFWCESDIYLSTKYSTYERHQDRVKFRRSKQLVLYILNTNSPYKLGIPKEIVESLLKLLPENRGDLQLRCAQDAASVILEKAWKLYIKVDRMIFNKTCLQSKKKKILQKILELSEARRAELLLQLKERGSTSPKSPKRRFKLKSAIKRKKPKKVKPPSKKVYSLATGTLATRPPPVENKRSSRLFEKQNKNGNQRINSEENAENGKKKTQKDSPMQKINKIKHYEKLQKVKVTKKDKKRKVPANAESAQHTEPFKQTFVPLKPKAPIDESQLNDAKATAERRMWRALQLALYISKQDYEGLPGAEKIDPYDLNYDENSYGSLHIEPLKIVFRPKPRVCVFRRPRRLQKLPKPKPVEEKKEAEPPPRPITPTRPQPKRDDIMQQYENLPPHARPYRNLNTGRWVYRPNKPPKNMSEIYTDSTNSEFFKRYLHSIGKDGPLLLWEAVENMKQMKDVKARQQHVMQTFKKFFQNKNNFNALGCTSDVLVRMTQMDKITPALLLSAQSVIAKEIESKWFFPYTLTFPETEDNTFGSQSSTKSRSKTHSTTSTDKEKAFAKRARDWAKSRAGVVHLVRLREQWKRFAQAINVFRHMLWDLPLCEQFIEYLNRKIIAEQLKSQDYKAGSKDGHVAIKKNINGRQVDMTRLPADVRFLCELERYRVLCDASDEAVMAGTYGVEDHAIVEKKAQLIMDCYIDSEVHPRIQINLPYEMATNISVNYHGGMLDRSLFHEANMDIYPHIIFLWQRFLEGLSTGAVTTSDTSGYRYWTNVQDDVRFDFFNLIAKRLRRQGTSEDEHPKYLFSLHEGLRLLLPAGNYYRSGSLEELYPELVKEILNSAGKSRPMKAIPADIYDPDKSFDWQKEGPAGEQSKRPVNTFARRLKAQLGTRRNAVVSGQDKIGFGQRKEFDQTLELDLDYELRQPGVHVRPRPYQSVSSL